MRSYDDNFVKYDAYLLLLANYVRHLKENRSPSSQAITRQNIEADIKKASPQFLEYCLDKKRTSKPLTMRTETEPELVESPGLSDFSLNTKTMLLRIYLEHRDEILRHNRNLQRQNRTISKKDTPKDISRKNRLKNETLSTEYIQDSSESITTTESVSERSDSLETFSITSANSRAESLQELETPPLSNSPVPESPLKALTEFEQQEIEIQHYLMAIKSILDKRKRSEALTEFDNKLLQRINIFAPKIWKLLYGHSVDQVFETLKNTWATSGEENNTIFVQLNLLAKEMQSMAMTDQENETQSWRSKLRQVRDKSTSHETIEQKAYDSMFYLKTILEKSFQGPLNSSEQKNLATAKILFPDLISSLDRGFVDTVFSEEKKGYHWQRTSLRLELYYNAILHDVISTQEDMVYECLVSMKHILEKRNQDGALNDLEIHTLRKFKSLQPHILADLEKNNVDQVFDFLKSHDMLKETTRGNKTLIFFELLHKLMPFTANESALFRAQIQQGRSPSSDQKIMDVLRHLQSIITKIKNQEILTVNEQKTYTRAEILFPRVVLRLIENEVETVFQDVQQDHRCCDYCELLYQDIASSESLNSQELLRQNRSIK